MYLSNLKLWNYKKYGESSGNPGLSVSFNPQLNILVGENDAGKTSIVNAIKLVLNTQSNDYNSPELEDFYLESGKEEVHRRTEFKIECTFSSLSNEEAKNFLEWLSFSEVDGEIVFYLKLTFVARRNGQKITYDLRTGEFEDGPSMPSYARELLRTTYLKPLRNSERELSPRRNSRLSQILSNHDAFSNDEEHELIKIIQEANEGINQYFQGRDAYGEDIEDKGGKKLLEEVNSYLENFSREGNLLKSNFTIADIKLKSILEKLSLQLFTNKAGLGSQNLLFIATELLLLKRENYSGLKLALVEEIEAHLHPQSQILLIEYLEDECSQSDIQLILTTHSPNLASKVDIERVLICKEDKVFNMSPSFTKLREGDYSFLKRFLDVTKSNLFFANGIIMVEGDAENILIPTLAEIIGIPLSKHGVSIINVGSTAFLRYSNIFLRENEQESMGISVSCITDLDVKPPMSGVEYKNGNEPVTYEASKSLHKEKKIELYSEGDVKCFVSKDWTLEYCIALGSFREEFFRAIKYAEYIKNSEKIGLTQDKIKSGDEFVSSELARLIEEGKTKDEIAFHIYNDYLLEKKISKAIVAQCFAKILSELQLSSDTTKERILDDENLEYLVKAIKFASKIGEEE